MSNKNEHSHHHHNAEHSPKKGIHHSPWFWVAVVLMLGGMGLYVGTMDEALGPGPQAGEEVPAAAE
jgi:Ni,Fe-hydrogenase I cytochrome b subunit